MTRRRGGKVYAEDDNKGDARSEFISWTTDRRVVDGMCCQDGVVLRIPGSSVAGGLVHSSDINDDFEVQAHGSGFDAEVLP